jgi:signal transduction histidine kinase/ligand-binding sensor domain-containing protein
VDTSVESDRRLCLLQAFLPAALLFLCAAPVHAGGRFDSWTTENGLPQNSINAILQTRDGYIWMATFGGLVRYDGVRFTVFDKANTNGLGSNRVLCLLETADGALWVGTEDGGVSRFKDGAFTAYTTADGLPENKIWGFVAGDESLLIVVTHHGAAHWQGDRFVPHPFTRKTINDASWALFYYEQHNRARLLEEQGSLLESLKAKLGDQAVTSIYIDGYDGIWIGAKSALMRMQSGVLTAYGEKDGVPNSAVVHWYEDRQGAIWMGTEGAGVLHFKDGRFSRYTTADGLSSESISAIFQDREGTMWIGTSNGGLNRLKRQIITDYSDHDGLVGKNAYPIFQDRSGDIWIGCGGLFRFREGKFTRYEHAAPPGLRADERPFVIPTALFQDSSGVFWMGAVGGLYRLESGRFTRERILPWPTFVWSIHQTSDRSLWFGCEAGLVRYEAKYNASDNAGRVEVFNTTNGLAGNDVKIISDDGLGGLWIGTYGGLSHFKDGHFTSYTQHDGLPSDRVRALYLDRDGALWVGTYDGGLARLKDDRFTQYTTRNGLFDEGVFQILEDARGNLWMSCNRGIYRVAKQQLNDLAEGKIQRISCISYGVQDGMLNAECNGGRQPAGIKARDGKLWFPTLDGVVVIDPDAVPLNTQPPPVMIEGVVIDRDAIDLRQGVIVTPGKQSVEIHYSGLSFINASKMAFKYKLEGLDREWVDAGDRRTAYYSHLPPGNYVFRVIAANSDGIWNLDGAALPVVVVPPIWRTWWFDGLAAVALVVLILAAYKRRVSKLEKANRAQSEFSRRLIQSQEDERKRLAAELHDGLAQNLLVIKNRAALGLAPAGDGKQARVQLDEISSTVTQALEEVRTLAHNLRPYQLDRLGLTMALESMVRKVSESSTIAFSADIDPVDGLLVPDAEINLYRIVQEALNNIVKHSGATKAQITVMREASGLTVTIQDNGSGFSLHGEETDGAHKQGMGLTGIAERARILGAKLTLSSAPGDGTAIALRLDL